MAVSARDDAPQNHSQDEAAVHGETKKKNSLVRGIVEFVIIVVIALALATGIRTFVIQPFFVPSGSMKQTLQINDRVVASKITTSISGVGRGEIMVFKDPGNWLPVMQPADDGWRSEIVLNGVALDETSYINGPNDQVLFDITVPNGGMFVMGDNRANSADSRFHLDQNDGAVPIDNAVGRVFTIVWPLSRITMETVPEIFGNPAIASGNSSEIE